MLMKSLTISNVIVLSWKNHYKHLLEDNPVVRYGIPLLGIALFIALIVLAHQGIYPFIQAYRFDDPRMIPVLLSALFMNVSLFTAVLIVVFVMLSPERNTLERSLHWMPVTGFQRKIGYYLPLIVIVLSFLLLLYVPVVLAVAQGVSFSLWQTILTLLSMVAQILFIQFVTLIFIELYGFVFGYVFGLPYHRLWGTGLALMTLMGYFAFQFRFDMLQTLYESMEFHFFYMMVMNLFLTIPNLLQEGSNFILLANGFFVLSVIGMFGVMALPAKRPEEKYDRLFQSIPFIRLRFLSVAIKEWKEIVRNRENRILLIMMVLISVMVLLWTDPSSLSGLVVIVIFVFSSFQSYHSYGRERERFASYASLPYPMLRWIFAKLFGNLTFNLVFAALLFLLFRVDIDWSFMTYLRYMYIGVLVTIGLFLAGIIIPYNPAQPYSTAFAAVIGSIVGLPSLYLVMQMMNAIPAVYYPIAAYASSGFLLLVIQAVFHWRWTHDHL